jgi:hypothetical protein
VQDVIRKEIGDVKFCVIVDEARDDKYGFIQERLFHIVHVKDTTALT